MAIKIKSITFHNFRQYLTGTLYFETEREHELSAFIAENGTGKTTILNAITWCLYGEEYQMIKGNARPLVNVKIWDEARDGEMIPVSVEMCVVDEEKDERIEFIREHTIIKSPKYTPILSLVDRSFKARVTPKGKNTRIIGGNSAQNPDEETADSIVRSIFDQTIHAFYFFDGESLQRLFETSLDQSIYSLSQVNTLRTAINHVKSYEKKLKTEIGKNSPDLQNLHECVEKADKFLKALKDDLREKEKDKEDAADKISLYDQKLKGLSGISQLAANREQLENTLNRLQKDEEVVMRKRSAFIREYMVLLNLYPRLKHALEYIQTKENEGALPPNIDKAKVEGIIAHPEEGCPLCKSELDDEKISYLKELLQKLSVSSRTAVFLTEMKSVVQEDMEKCENYLGEKKKQETEIQRIREDVADTKNKIERINRQIAARVDNKGVQDVRSMEAERKKAITEKSECEVRIETLNKQIDEQEETVKKKAKEYQEALDAVNKSDKIKQKLNVANILRENFESVEESIVSMMKAEIEQETKRYFDEMIWKTNTFGEIKIDDNYRVFVYDREDNEMTASLSATERMALAYAFTLAIHEASGKNCPLLIDSPLGRVSGENREKMAKVLLEISRGKQIIMLFTPDEYSTQVQEAYRGIVHAKTLRLTNDEKYVQGDGLQ